MSWSVLLWSFTKSLLEDRGAFLVLSAVMMMINTSYWQSNSYKINTCGFPWSVSCAWWEVRSVIFGAASIQREVILLACFTVFWNFPLLPKTWLLTLLFCLNFSESGYSLQELFLKTDDQELIQLSSAPSFSYKRMAVCKDPLVQSHEHVGILLNVKAVAYINKLIKMWWSGTLF